MKNLIKELVSLYENDNCDYVRCDELIDKIGGCTQIIEIRFGFKTTPLHLAVESGHYDFAIDLIENQTADFDVSADCEPLMWELQYLDSKTENEQRIESGGKLKVALALIRAGANPNPTVDGESLLNYIRFKISEDEEEWLQAYHLWEMEHMIDSCTNNKMEYFVEKLKSHLIKSIMISDLGYWLMDDNLCDCDHVIFCFDDDEKILLSSSMVNDDEWDFYAVPIQDNWFLSDKYHNVLPTNELIKFVSLYSHEENPTSHWLDLSLDDAYLRIHADEPNLMVGVVNPDENSDWEKVKRQTIFIDK